MQQQANTDRYTVVTFLLSLFARRGAESYPGEAVSMSEHMLQTAMRAEQGGAPDSLVAAALLHDIGHFVSDFPEDAWEQGVDNLHEEAAARFLRMFYPPAVIEPIRLHVAAKRYLCAVEPAYLAHLSVPSLHSLSLQGGPMTAEEVEVFAMSPYHDAAVSLRRWDDAGKVPGLKIVPVAYYQPLLMRLLIF